MPILLQCPKCGKMFRARDELAGRQTQCKCGTLIPIPAPASGAQPAPDAPPAASPKPAAVRKPASGAKPAPSPKAPPGAKPLAPIEPELVADLLNEELAGPSLPLAGDLSAGTPLSQGSPLVPLGGSPLSAGRPLGSRSYRGSMSAEDGLRLVVGVQAIGYGAYYAYQVGYLLWKLSDVGLRVDWLSFGALRTIALLLTCLALVGAGIGILALGRAVATFALVAALAVAGVVVLDIGVGLYNLIKFSSQVGRSFDLLAAGQGWFNVLVHSAIRLAFPVLVAWWCQMFGRRR